MRLRLSLSILAALGLTACASGPSHSYETIDEAGLGIVAALDSGQDRDAAELFDDYGRSESDRELLYPVLFDSAHSRYEAGQAQSSANILAFMAERYPYAVGVREALLYSLFIERAGRDAADPALTEELDDAIVGLRSATSQPPAWVDLVQTQQEIDRGRVAEARATFGSFLANWSGEPAALMTYVEDLDRYLASH